VHWALCKRNCDVTDQRLADLALFRGSELIMDCIRQLMLTMHETANICLQTPPDAVLRPVGGGGDDGTNA
jgi:hypothetical protein